METLGQDLGAIVAALPPIAAHVMLSEGLCAEICSTMTSLASPALYGWIVGPSPSWSKIQSWLQASLEITSGCIQEVFLLV